MSGFHFNDAEWDAIGDELERHTGRLKYDGDRRSIEMICDRFVRLRPRLGKGLPTPTAARDAWIEVANAAVRLDSAIAGLRTAGAADFTIIDNHKGTAADWAAALPEIMQAAQYWAELETLGARTVSNKSDPVRNGLVVQIVRMWQGFGGNVGTGYNNYRRTSDNPLVRFIAAVTTPVMVAAGEKPLTLGTIRGIVRNHMAS